MVGEPAAGSSARRPLGWLVLGLWVAFGALTWLVATQLALVVGVDIRIAVPLHEFAAERPWVVTLGRVLDVIGSGMVCFALVAVVVLVLVVKGALTRPFGAPMFAAVMLVASAALIATAIKGAVERPRPPWNGLWVLEESSSYPSGHAQAGISVWVAVGIAVLLVDRGRRGWLIALPFLVIGPLIGISRTVIGVHWPSDVLGGWLLGAACLGTSALIVRRWQASAAAGGRSHR